jgi:hypothetical protein
VVAVAIAIAKPWPGPPPAVPGATLAVVTTRSSMVAVLPTPSLTPVPTAPPERPPDSTSCHSEVAWRLVVVELGGRREQRTWFAMRRSASARSPEDPSIPFRRVISEDVVAMGFCSPRIDAGFGLPLGPLRAEGARLWRSVGGRTQELRDLRLVEPPESGIAELYRPAQGAGAWEPGDYVFRVTDPLLRTLWFGLHIVAPRRR